MAVIDAHVNLTADGRWFHTGHDASLERLLDEMASADIGQALLVALPGAADNRFIADTCARHPERFRGLGHIKNWSRAEAELDELTAMGLKGVKVHPRSQGLDVLAPELEPAWQGMVERGLPVMIDGYFQNLGSSLPLAKLTPFYYDRLARRHPDLRIILAHAGAQRVMDAFWVARSNPNFYLDISHVLEYYAGTSLMADFAFVLAMADQKIIFGSDFPECGPGPYLRRLEALCQDGREVDLELVRQGNIRKLIDFD